jgi:hypothetical protein
LGGVDAGVGIGAGGTTEVFEGGGLMP